MKQLFFAAIISISAMSFAANQKPTGTLEFNVKSASFSSVQVKNAGNATLSVDYSNSKVKLSVESRPDCAKGMMCPQSLRLVVIELPITKVETNSCGVHIVTASKDERPVDGSLQTISLNDVSDMNCGTTTADATYTTSFFDRRSAKEVNAISKMSLSLASDSNVAKVLLKYVQGSGFSPKPSVITISVYSNGKISSLQKFFSTGEEKIIDIAQLSKESMKNLKTQLQTVPTDAKLVDQNEGEPKCTDAPDTTISATVNDQDVAIYRWSSCHTYKSFEGDASSLVLLMQGFVSLAR